MQRKPHRNIMYLAVLMVLVLICIGIMNHFSSNDPEDEGVIAP